MLKGLFALSPLMVFVILYLATSLALQDFYKVPLTVAFLLSAIYGIAFVAKGNLSQRVETFCNGAGTGNIMLMIVIFILAGAFVSIAEAMGSIDAAVNLALQIMPDSMLLAGLFLAACFISLSIGTSVGTIAALVPIAAGLADTTGQSTALFTAAVVGGAFFGDNLSFISDTTIMATKTQGCRMSDKFRTNLAIVLPAAMVVLLIYIFIGRDITTSTPASDVNLWKVLPYLIVLVTASFGMNVLAVITLGITSAAVIGLADGSYDYFTLLSSMGKGIISMSELIIVTLLAAGLLEIIKHAGGIDFIIKQMTAKIQGKRGAELTIGSLVALVDLCTANNTIAILTVGDISRKISQRYGIDPRRAASILDTFSCFMQGLIPYGAQMLIAAGLAQINPIEIIPNIFYPYLMGVMAVLAILFRYPKRYS